MTVIAEVKSDMERPVPMDRWSSATSYSKTEIAVRAAFKCRTMSGGHAGARNHSGATAADRPVRRMTGFQCVVKGLRPVPTDARESKRINRRRLASEWRSVSRRRHPSPAADRTRVEGPPGW